MVAIIDLLYVIPSIGLLISIIIDRTIRTQIGSRILHVLNLFSSVSAIIIMFFGVKDLEEFTILESDYVTQLNIDWLSIVFIMFVFVILLVVQFYSYYYFEPRDYISISAMIWGMYIGIVTVLMSTNLVIVFLGWEVMVIAGYLMVVFNRNEKSLEAGLKYLILSTFGSMMMLFGIAIIFGQLNSLNFEDFSIISESFWGRTGIALLICGIGVTAGIVFLNQWLPDAHSSAPSPVSALLSGVLVKLGVYLIYRIINQLNGSEDISLVMVIIGVITITEGNIMVFAQFYRSDMIDIKRIFAYSTTVHLGFLFLIISQYSTTSHLALIYHVINHGIAKTALFLLVGYLYKIHHSKDLNDLKGRLQGDNRLALVLIIALFSLGGFPGTGGFISKLLILIAMYNGLTVGFAWKIMLLWIILLNTLFGLIGYLLLIKWLVFDQNENPQQANSDYKILRYPLYILVAIILCLGIMPSFFLEKILKIIN